METDRDKRIRARAYEIWERSGRAEGGHEAHWLDAEREIDQQNDRDGAEAGDQSTSGPEAAGLAGGVDAIGTKPGDSLAEGEDTLASGPGDSADRSPKARRST
jgi:hypothetical protein